jgi:hypothetical protein
MQHTSVWNQWFPHWDNITEYTHASPDLFYNVAPPLNLLECYHMMTSWLLFRTVRNKETDLSSAFQEKLKKVTTCRNRSDSCLRSAQFKQPTLVGMLHHEAKSIMILLQCISNYWQSIWHNIPEYLIRMNSLCINCLKVVIIVTLPIVVSKSVQETKSLTEWKFS